MLTTHGSAIFADNVPTRDDAIAARLRAAGCVLVGKTRMPEFGHKGLTDGPSFGATPNPWDLTRTSGGSSGGAAAAVAAGLGPLALGTDGAGSIRIPAAACGVVGHKPTLGAVPWESALDAFGNYTYGGPIARTVTDAALMHAALSGPSPRDPWSLGNQDQGRLSPGLVGMDLSCLRIGVVALAANLHVDHDVAANTALSLGALEAQGAAIEPIDAAVDWIEYPGRIMYQANFAVAMEQHRARWENQMDPTLLAFMERGPGLHPGRVPPGPIRPHPPVPRHPGPALPLRHARHAHPHPHRPARRLRRRPRPGRDRPASAGASPARAGPPTSTPSTSPATPPSPSPPASRPTVSPPPPRSSAAGAPTSTSSEWAPSSKH